MMLIVVIFSKLPQHKNARQEVSANLYLNLLLITLCMFIYVASDGLNKRGLGAVVSTFTSQQEFTKES